MSAINVSKGISTFSVIQFHIINTLSNIQVSSPIKGKNLNMFKNKKVNDLFPYWYMSFETYDEIKKLNILNSDDQKGNFNDDDTYILIAETEKMKGEVKYINGIYAYKIPMIKTFTPKEKTEIIYNDGSKQFTFEDMNNAENKPAEMKNNTPNTGFVKKKSSGSKTGEKHTKISHENFIIGKVDPNSPVCNLIAWRKYKANHGIGFAANRDKDGIYYIVYISSDDNIYITNIRFKTLKNLRDKYPYNYKEIPSKGIFELTIFIPDEYRSKKVLEKIKNGEITNNVGAKVNIRCNAIEKCLKEATEKFLNVD